MPLRIAVINWRELSITMLIKIVISQNITILPRFQISRWYSISGKITDIIILISQYLMVGQFGIDVYSICKKEGCQIVGFYWRCHTFIRSRMACDISSGLYDIYSGSPALRSASIKLSPVS